MATGSQATVPNLAGKVAVVTGASSGLGEAAASALARAGAKVILAVRDAEKGAATRAKILTAGAAQAPVVELVDLAVLASVRDFARRVSATQPKIDILLNNAGLMQVRRTLTPDGFERVFATNHLGHFALTGLLLQSLLNAEAPRVVTVSSIAHRGASIGFDDLQGEKSYSGSRAYAQSKLANLLFALELNRRAEASGSALVSVAAHPGVSRTGFLAASNLPAPFVGFANLAIGAFLLDADGGARPLVQAATEPELEGGSYLGPDGFKEIRGRPGRATIDKAARDPAVASRLWDRSKELTGVSYDAIGG